MFNILLVDDKAMNSEMKVDLVIMDHRMPVMDGLEATRKIKSLDGNAKIKFISADHGVKEEALKAGATDFIQKPLTLKTLLKNIEKVLSQNNMLREK